MKTLLCHPTATIQQLQGAAYYWPDEYDEITHLTTAAKLTRVRAAARPKAGRPTKSQRERTAHDPAEDRLG